MDKLTPEEFENEMRLIVSNYGHDREVMHSKMDVLMCKVLESLGYHDGTAIFRAEPKWYA